MSTVCPSGCKRDFKPSKIVRNGFFYRTSDRKRIQRFRCALCGVNFSHATTSQAFGQKKRHLNHKIFELLCSGVSQRRAARILKTQQKTVARKLTFLGLKARHLNLISRRARAKASLLQFDDLETFEHTKMKPLSVTLMVEEETRYILGFEVSRMPAKGHLAKRSLKKYGPRKDERRESRDRLFRRVKASIETDSLIKSDENPHYHLHLKEHFPESTHVRFKGQRGAITGQGELKKIEFDPLFSLNHTCAMFRANVNRLIRKTWCTTKKIQPLIDHLELYVFYHNQVLLKNK